MSAANDYDSNLQGLLQAHIAHKQSIRDFDNYQGMVDAVDQNRDERLHRNKMVFQDYHKRLNTLRRQIEISHNSYLIKGATISVLKLAVMCCLLSIGVLFYLRSSPHLSNILLAIFGVFFVLIIFRLWKFTYRDHNRWNIIRWNTNQKPRGGKDECSADLDRLISNKRRSREAIENELRRTRTRLDQLDTGDDDLRNRISILKDRKKEINNLINAKKKSVDEQRQRAEIIRSASRPKSEECQKL